MERIHVDNHMQHNADDMYYARSKIYYKKYWYEFLKKTNKLKDRLLFLFRSIFHFIFFAFCGHGEKPSRAFLIISSFIFIFSFIFSHFNLIMKSSCENPVGYWESFYFSIITFTTLGYGDILPRDAVGQILVIIEVMVGYFMLGALVAIIIRKITR